MGCKILGVLREPRAEAVEGGVQVRHCTGPAGLRRLCLLPGLSGPVPMTFSSLCLSFFERPRVPASEVRGLFPDSFSTLKVLGKPSFAATEV